MVFSLVTADQEKVKALMTSIKDVGLQVPVRPPVM